MEGLSDGRQSEESHVCACTCVHGCVCVCVEEQQGIKMPPALQSELPSSGLWPQGSSQPLSYSACLSRQGPGRASVSLGVAPEQQSSGKRGLELLASQYKTLPTNTENLHELPE